MFNSNLFVISGPSGVGKTACARQICDIEGIALSISYTSRPPRDGEQDGVDYHFVTEEQFLAMIDEGAFAEWAPVHGAYYGTAKANLESALGQRDVLLEIDYQGALNIKREYNKAVLIFLLPESRAQLKQRLENRRKDSPEVIKRRVMAAMHEITQMYQFDACVVNREGDLAGTLRKLSEIINEKRTAGRICGNRHMNPTALSQIRAALTEN